MTRTYVYGASAPVSGADLVHAQLARAHRYSTVLAEVALAHRAAYTAAGEDGAAIAAAHEESNVAVRRERGRCGLYWGTYLQVEDAAQRSRRTGRPPTFRTWDGGGTVAAQIQHGMSVEDLLGGQDRRVKLLHGRGKHYALLLRVGSLGVAPVWATFPVVYHRDMPPPGSGLIKAVKCVARRVATKLEWSVQFVVDCCRQALPAGDLDTLAIDVGWRRFPGAGIRAAVWVDSAGASGEVRIPERLVGRWNKIEDLSSIRKRNFNAARTTLLDWRAQADAMPARFALSTRSLSLWESPRRLANLALRWRKERFAGDDGIYGSLEAWREQDKHLYEWTENQRANILGSRREQYRLFARHAARYRRVVIEELDLREFAVEDATEDPRTTVARGRRFQVALSELLGCVADAVGRAGGELIEVDPAGTTQTCSECGAAEPFDAASAVDHTCGHCGRTWDQDRNAARNLLARAATCGAGAGKRSRRQKTAPTEDSPAAVRRAKGLATRRARRSKTGAQPTVIAQDP